LKIVLSQNPIIINLMQQPSPTFLVSPDTHFTQSGGVADVAGIVDMNNLEGVAYPKETIRGVVEPGDLIDDGCSASSVDGGGCVAQLVSSLGIGRARRVCGGRMELVLCF
jgi:hypothetical protein